jgi:hypothetical protein
MNKLTRESQSIKVWFLLFCCLALWKGKMGDMAFVTATGGVVVARTYNKKRYDEKDSA